MTIGFGQGIDDNDARMSYAWGASFADQWLHDPEGMVDECEVSPR